MTTEQEMSSKWCVRRAEMVLKCIKGFVMENAVWAGKDPHTFQFVVPEEATQQMFDELSNTVSSVFRVASTLQLGKK